MIVSSGLSAEYVVSQGQGLHAQRCSEKPRQLSAPAAKPLCGGTGLSGSGAEWGIRRGPNPRHMLTQVPLPPEGPAGSQEAVGLGAGGGHRAAATALSTLLGERR